MNFRTTTGHFFHFLRPAVVGSTFLTLWVVGLEPFLVAPAVVGGLGPFLSTMHPSFGLPDGRLLEGIFLGLRHRFPYASPFDGHLRSRFALGFGQRPIETQQIEERVDRRLGADVPFAVHNGFFGALGTWQLGLLRLWLTSRDQRFIDEQLGSWLHVRGAIDAAVIHSSRWRQFDVGENVTLAHFCSVIGFAGIYLGVYASVFGDCLTISPGLRAEVWYFFSVSKQYAMAGWYIGRIWTCL